MGSVAGRRQRLPWLLIEGVEVFEKRQASLMIGGVPEKSGTVQRHSLRRKSMKLKHYLFGALAALAAPLLLAAVNINTATAEELKALPGIGPSKAAAIVAYREQNGSFKSVDDLQNVKGIGAGILAKLREEATVGAGAAKKAQPAVKKTAGK